MRELIFISPCVSPQVKKSRKRRRSTENNEIVEIKTKIIQNRPPTPTEGFIYFCSNFII